MVDDLKKTSVKFNECYAFDELVHGEVFHPVSHEAGLSSDGTCQERFSASCPAVYEKILGSVYEGAVHKFEQHLLAQIPLFRTDYIFHYGIVAQLAGLEVHFCPLAVAVLPFRFSKSCNKGIQSRPLVYRHTLKGFVALRHTLEFESFQLEDRFLCSLVYIHLCVGMVVLLICRRASHIIVMGHI